MYKSHLLWAILALILLSVAGASGADVQPYSYPVPQQAATRTRHTTFLASFDAPDHADADYCRHDPLNCGTGYDCDVPGRFGRGVALGALQSSLAFSGYDNYDPQHGTAGFWAKAPAGRNVWADGEYHWMLILYPDSPLPYEGRLPCVLFLYRDNHNMLNLDLFTYHLPLYSFIQWSTPTPALHLEISTASLSPDDWHHFQVGWEIGPSTRLWLGIDGRGVTAAISLQTDNRRPVPGGQIFLGSIVFPSFTGHQPFAGTFDDFVITSISPAHQPQAAPAADDATLMAMEDAVRAWLDTCLQLQEGGGWMAWYQWPALRPAWQHHQIQDADDFSLEAVCTLMLRAYDLWGDERYLWACKQAGNFLVQAQTPAGCWAQYYAMTPAGPKPDLPSGNLEEQTQSFPLRFLAHLYRVTGNKLYLQACKKAGEYVLARQDPDGWWPWGYNWQTGKIEGHGGPTLNDDAFGTSLEDMIVMYGVTGERKYLDAIIRAGQWLINAQVKTGPARGWADQYDPPHTPCWGREMEPPSVSMAGTPLAVRDLFKLYDLTGDARYLRPIELCVDWLQSQPKEYRGWLYYDLDSGEPIMSYKGEVFSVFSDKFQEYLPQFSAHYSSGHAGWYAPQWERELQLRRAGPQFPSWQGWRPRADFAKLLPTRDAVAALAQAAPDPVKLDALQQWEESRSGPLVIDVAEYASKMLYFYRGNDYAADLLDLIEARRIALGDVPPAILPVYSRATLGNFPYIQPHKDWYDTPLGPTDKLADRGLKLRLRRRPHFIEMAAGGKAVFTLNVTNWSGAPLAGTVTVDRAPGLKVTPASRKFNLPPDKAADLQFSISDAGAEPGYVDIEFVLTYGDMTERVPIRARIYAAGQGLDSKQYQGSELLGLTPRRQEFKLLAGDTLTTRLTIRNLTFENITVNLSFESPPPGVKTELRPATLRLRPRETKQVTVSLKTTAAAVGNHEVSLVAAFDGRSRRAALVLELLDPGTTVMREAEAADSIGPPFEVGAAPEASGGRYLSHRRPPNFTPRPLPADHRTGGYADFQFELPTAASVQVWIRALWLDGGGNSFWVSVDGGPESVIGNDEASGWHWVKGPRYSLAAGRHTLRIHDRETGARLDKVLIVRAG